MAIKINIRKILTTMIWGCIGSGVLVLLVAAIRYRNSNTCKGYVINLTGSSISKREVLALLTPTGTLKIQQRHIQSFDLRRLEMTLEKNIWVQKSRLFFDNNNLLHIDVIGRTPVARVFTVDGNSFYLDSNGVQLPLPAQVPLRLPVFTGYPSTKIGHNRPDSAIDAGVREISSFFRRDTFWMAQIAQVNIASDRTFELEPVNGPRVSFGSGTDVAAKFHRLHLFDQQVLSRVGPDRYERIDVSYANQVVATRKGIEQRRYDSLQGLNNIRQLIFAAQQLQPDTLRQQSVRPLETNTMTEQNLSTHDLLPAGDSPVAVPPALRRPAPPTHKPKP
jgi:cell division protein FtsQ